MKGRGAMTEQLVLQRTMTSKDNSGGSNDSGYVTADTVWAEELAFSSRERLAMQAVQSTTTHRFRTDVRSDVTAADWRLLWTPSWINGGPARVLGLTADPIPDPDDPRTYMILDATERGRAMSYQHIPHKDLRVALQTVLNVADLTALLNGGVVSKLKDSPLYPLVRVVVRGRSVGAIASSGIWECEAEIDIYSTYDGTAEAYDIANVIVGLLDLQPLTVEGWTVISMSVQDLAPVEDELVGDEHVGRWQIPVLIHTERAA